MNTTKFQIPDWAYDFHGYKYPFMPNSIDFQILTNINIKRRYYIKTFRNFAKYKIK
jgi:hypothetical protein